MNADSAANNTALLLLAVGSGWVGNLLPRGVRADVENSRTLQIAMTAAMIATSFTWTSNEHSLPIIARDTAITLGWFLVMDKFNTNQFMLVSGLLVASAIAKRASRVKDSQHAAKLAKASHAAAIAAAAMTAYFAMQ